MFWFDFGELFVWVILGLVLFFVQVIHNIF